MQLLEAFVIKHNDKLIVMETSDQDDEVSIKLPYIRSEVSYVENGVRYEITRPESAVTIIIGDEIDHKKIRVVVNDKDINLELLKSEKVGTKTVYLYTLGPADENRQNIQVLDIEGRRTLSRKNYIIIGRINCHFNRQFYFSDSDFVEAAALVSIGEQKSRKIAFNRDDKVISVPYGYGMVEIRVPVIKVIDNLNNVWDGNNTYWIKSIAQNTFLNCIAPANVDTVLNLDDEKIGYENGSGYGLGNALAAYSVDDEDDWLNLNLCVYSKELKLLQKYTIGKITSIERFIRKPKLRIEDEKILWDRGYGFIGNTDSDAFVSISMDGTDVIDKTLNFSDDVISDASGFEEGEYKYVIYKKSGNIFSTEQQILARGSFYAGDENEHRFKGKYIELTSITSESKINGSLKVVSIKPSYIDNIKFEGVQKVKSEDRECPVYSGILYFIAPNSHKRKEYSYSKCMSDDGMALCKVNLVRIIYINDTTVNVTDDDGDGLIYRRMYSRAELKNYYYITDWDSDAPQNRPYRDNYDAVDLFSYKAVKNSKVIITGGDYV